MRDSAKVLSPGKWSHWAVAALCAPLLLLVLSCGVGIYGDLRQVREGVVQAEVHRLRSAAIYRAARLETLLETDGEAISWPTLRKKQWLLSYWSQISLLPEEVYAAVVDASGTIVMHTDPERIGQRLTGGWYSRRLPEVGEDVVQLHNSALGGDTIALNVAIPLTVAGQRVGDFHEGLAAAYLDAKTARAQRARLLTWLGFATVVALTSLLAVAALAYLNRVRAVLASGLAQARQRHERQLAQIGSGLAHEVRNPLHALRINLHLLRRELAPQALTDDALVAGTIQDCDVAIDRLGGLMTDLLRFADPHLGQPAEIDLGYEVQATLHLVAEDFRREQIELHTELTEQPAIVSMEPARLRQLVLNLLTFAQHKAGRNGRVDVKVSRNGTMTELIIADSGQTLTDMQRATIFEPFQAPKETGSGLGLALVQAFVNEVGGTVHCDKRSPTGNCFCVRLPMVSAASSGGKL